MPIRLNDLREYSQRSVTRVSPREVPSDYAPEAAATAALRSRGANGLALTETGLRERERSSSLGELVQVIT
jgi:hypothetical protein